MQWEFEEKTQEGAGGILREASGGNSIENRTLENEKCLNR